MNFDRIGLGTLPFEYLKFKCLYLFDFLCYGRYGTVAVQNLLGLLKRKVGTYLPSYFAGIQAEAQERPQGQQAGLAAAADRLRAGQEDPLRVRSGQHRDRLASRVSTSTPPSRGRGSRSCAPTCSRGPWSRWRRP